MENYIIEIEYKDGSKNSMLLSCEELGDALLVGRGLAWVSMSAFVHVVDERTGLRTTYKGNGL